MFKEKLLDKKSDLMARVVWNYYKLDLTQKEVGDKLNISRQKAQRLLKEANENGVVQVKLNLSTGNLLTIEEDLKEKYSLSDAVVIPSPPPESSLRDLLGSAADTYIDRLIVSEDIEVMGIGWGKTLRAFADQFQPKHPVEKMDIVSLVGNLEPNIKLNPYSIAVTIARKLSADAYNIWAPSIVENPQRAEQFKAEPWIRQVLEKAKSADIMVVSLGQVSTESTLYQLGYLSEDEINSLQSQGAVGDIIGRFFDARGKLVKADLYNRVIGLNFNEIREGESRVIAIAGGGRKLQAIKGALNGNFVDVLITGENIAKELT